MESKLTPMNVHRLERVLRILLGLGILSLLFVGPQSPWALLGLIPVVTGLLGTCPLYTLLGVKTCRGTCQPFLGTHRPG